ncbi:MAG TPA: branched-chain amino acid ABC transporter permease [Bellilinea sp.]|nr:branched-chain amino acid ABC transporter permease [Bellilinea sp.]
MEGFLQQISTGLAAGGIYASLALALVMIYRSTHHLNFAQGEMATFSTFLAATLLQLGWGYWTVFLVVIGASFAMGVGIQRLLLERLEMASPLTKVIAFIGLMLLFNGLSGWLFGYSVQSFPSPFESRGTESSRFISEHELGVIGIVAICMLLLFAFFRYTSLGLALRATALNPESARLVSIRVSSMLGIGWGLAAAIGAVSGMMVAPTVFLDPSMMSGILIYGFAAALLGGIDNPSGAVAGGFMVGVAENLLGAYVIGPDLKLTVALGLIIGVLTLKPDGLFGQKVVVRV